MAELPRYSAAGIQYADLPKISLAVVEESQRGAQMLQDKIGQLTSFAFKKAGQQAVEQAKRFAAENPITQEQINAAKNRTNQFESFLGAFTGKGGTMYQNALAEAQGSILANELSLKAAEEFNNIKNLADNLKIGREDALAMMADATDGYVATVTAFSPDAGIRLRAEMATQGNVVLKHISDLEAKTIGAAVDAELTNSLQIITRNAEDIYANGDVFDPESQQYIEAESIVDTQIMPFMEKAGLHNRASFITAANEVRRTARISGLSAGITSGDFSSDESSVYSRMNSGDMGKYQRMWDVMPEKDRDEVKKKVKEFYSEKNRLEKEQKESNRNKLEKDRGHIQWILGTQDVSEESRNTLVDFMYRANMATDGPDVFSQEYIDLVARGDVRKNRLSSAQMAKYKSFVEEGFLTPVDTERMVDNLEISGFEKEELDKIFYSNENPDFRDATTAIKNAFVAIPGISEKRAKRLGEEAVANFRASLEADVDKKMTTRQHRDNAISAARQSFDQQQIQAAQDSIVNLFASVNVRRKLSDEFRSMTSENIKDYVLRYPDKVRDVFENPDKNTGSINNILNNIKIINGG